MNQKKNTASSTKITRVTSDCLFVLYRLPSLSPWCQLHYNQLLSAWDMGRTLPTATMLLDMEKQAWKPFRNGLDKKDRKKFDEMLSLAHVFNYAQMMSMPDHPVAIQPILMSIVFSHYKQLIKIMEELDMKGRSVKAKCSVCGKKLDFEGTPVNPLICWKCLTAGE